MTRAENHLHVHQHLTRTKANLRSNQASGSPGQKQPIWAILWREDYALSLLRSNATAAWGQREGGEEEGTAGATADQPLRHGLCGSTPGSASAWGREACHLCAQTALCGFLPAPLCYLASVLI